MISHRIKELREARRLSQERLGEMIGRSKSVISRLEDGSTSLDLRVASQIAEKLGVSLAEVLGIEGQDPVGFAEDLTPYTPYPQDPLKGFSGPHRYLYTVETDCLAKTGVLKGDVVVIDDSAERCRAVAPLENVVVLYHPAGETKAVLLFRQYVPPTLLITNSGAGNERSIDMGIEDATIVGVLVHVHRSVRRPV